LNIKIQSLHGNQEFCSTLLEKYKSTSVCSHIRRRHADWGHKAATTLQHKIKLDDIDHCDLLRPRITLTFYLLLPKVNWFMPLPHGHGQLVLTGIKTG